MSEAIYDPVAYTTLTDSIIHQILVSTDPQLQEVRMYTFKIDGNFILCKREKLALQIFYSLNFCKYVACLVLRVVTDKFSRFYFHGYRLTRDIHEN